MSLSRVMLMNRQSIDPQAIASLLSSWTSHLASRMAESIAIVSIPLEPSSCRDFHEVARAATGFAIDKNTLVTVAHINPSEQLCVVDAFGNRYSGKVLSLDKRWDIAFVETEANLRPLELSLELPSLGSLVVACGMPFGVLRPFFTLGMISGYNVNTVIYDESLEGLLISSSPVMPGMSGGPVVEIAGKVVGMIVANAMNNNEFALAIPSRRIHFSYRILKKIGKVTHIGLGIRVVEGLSSNLNKVVVSSIRNNKLREICGIDIGDSIEYINGRKIQGLQDIWDALDESLLSSSKSLKIVFYDLSSKNIKECSYPITLTI